MNKQMSPELKDFMEILHRYIAINKDVGFVWAFVSFEKDGTHKCIDCGEDCDKVKENASRIGAYGDLGLLRDLTNDLRDLIEDEVDEDGFVNV
jgi:hypothetical protein